jgi:hypothetical protein
MDRMGTDLSLSPFRIPAQKKAAIDRHKRHRLRPVGLRHWRGVASRKSPRLALPFMGEYCG